MTMTPWWRKFALIAHVTTSLGWFGAVAGFLALAVAGLTSADAQVVRGAYLSMGVLTSIVIVPFCLASLLTGLVQSLGTPWGLLRHYWVVAKLVLTVLSTLILLLHTQPIYYLASVAAERTLDSGELRELRIQLLVDASAALVVLVVATVLAVYKPRGKTRYGRRKEQKQSAGVS